MNLASWSTQRENNFDVLRLAAATLVLVSHSFVVVGAHEPHVGRWPLGTLGVEIFFAISGFLIAKSWLSQPRLRAFAVKRGLRILPALIATVLACTLLLGPLVSSDSTGAYFSNPQTPEFVVDNVVATVSGGAVRDIALDLPGVYDSNPAHSVDLSLWTLPIEIRAYMLVAALGLLGLLIAGLPLMAACFFALSIAGAGVADVPVIGSALEFLRGTDGETAHLVALFAVAALFYVWRERIPLRGDLAALALIVLVATLGTPVERPLLLFAIPYLALFLAYRSPSQARVLTSRGDVSYGLYLLAFPVQQTLVQAWDGLPSPALVALIGFPITYLLAMASWHWIERPALRLKGPLATPRHARPRAQPPPASVPDSDPAAVRI
ncbi:MAG TPA: acyltransferase [Thermoleophilaceae bacterium]